MLTSPAMIFCASASKRSHQDSQSVIGPRRQQITAVQWRASLNQAVHLSGRVDELLGCS
jgi:hypothetical protein